jgi:hypothetical protein
LVSDRSTTTALLACTSFAATNISPAAMTRLAEKAKRPTNLSPPTSMTVSPTIVLPTRTQVPAKQKDMPLPMPTEALSTAGTVTTAEGSKKTAPRREAGHYG